MRQFSMGAFFIGVTLHEREFYRWAAIYLEISWWKFFKGQFSWLLWEIFLFSCSQLNELKIKSETLLCSFIYWINVSPEFFRVNVLSYKKAMVLSQIVFTSAT